MKNIYYLIWVDIITSAKRFHPNRSDWKFALFVLITMCNALNLFVIQLWIKFFGIFSFSMGINIFPGNILNSAVNFIIHFAPPFILLNYFLIFHKDRYKKIVEKYPQKKGRLALIYTLSSIWLGVFSVILYGALT